MFRTNARPPDDVVLVTTDLAVGGAQSLMAAMAKHFAAAGRRVAVVSLEGDGPHAADLRAHGVNVACLVRRWRWDLRPAIQLRRLLSEFDASCVICFGLYEYLFFRLGRCCQPDSPVLVSIHSTDWASPYRQAQHWVYARLLGRQTRIVAVCDAQADYWSAKYCIPRERFVRIYNGVDTAAYRPASSCREVADSRERAGIPEGAFVIVLVAALHDYKRHEVATAALAMLRTRRPQLDAHLLLVGGDPVGRASGLAKLARHLGVAGAVHLVGVQTDVRSFLLASDVFTLTSAWAETFSLAALEAMSTGLPAVLTDVGGAREMVRDGANGYVVPPENAPAIALAWDKVSRGELEWRADDISRHVRERFSARDCLDAYLDLVDSCGR